MPMVRIDVPGSGFTTGTVPAWAYEDKPAFEWLAVPGADSYEIAVHGEGLTWKETTSTTGLHTLSSLPKLKQDQEYAVSIVPMFKSRPLFKTKEAWLLTRQFQVMNRPSNSDIAAATDSLKKLALPPTVVTFLTGKLFAYFGLYDEAIVTLRGLRGQLNEPALGRELGEVYTAKGSYGDAEKELTDAMLLFRRTGDFVGQALAEEAIAAIQVKSQGGIPRAIAHLRAALRTYKTLGDAPDAERVQTSLKSLETLNTRQPRR